MLVESATSGLKAGRGLDVPDGRRSKAAFSKEPHALLDEPLACRSRLCHARNSNRLITFRSATLLGAGQAVPAGRPTQYPGWATTDKRTSVLTTKLRFVDPTRPPGVLVRAYAAVAATRLAKFISRHINWKLDPLLLRVTRGRLATTLVFPTGLLETQGDKSG